MYIMIPDDILVFLKRQLFLHVGSRDSKLRPREIMAWGIAVGDDKKSISILIPESTAEKTLGNFQQNGRVALTCVNLPSHDTYQFKGAYVSHRKCSEQENDSMDPYMAAYGEILKTIGMSGEFLSPVAYKPAIEVKINVEEIFVQTPGPNAGNKIL
jgi:hypothetical protein